MRYERHDMLHLSRAGRERIANELAGKGFERAIVAEMLLPDPAGCDAGRAVPGIVRREECGPRDGYIPVGFTSWRAYDRGRLRMASFALPREVVSMSSPESVLQKFATWEGEKARRTPALATLAALNRALRPLHFALGVWGSAAMEVETGHHYTHPFSDLDVLLSPKEAVGRDELRACLDAVLKLEQNAEVRIDAELRTRDAYGVSLKELLGKGETVLGKGRKDVALLRKTDVFDGLALSLPDRDLCNPLSSRSSCHDRSKIQNARQG